MAQIKVSEMEKAEELNEDDLFMIIQNDKNKRMAANLLKSFINKPKIYTVRFNKNSSSPVGERMDDAIGLVANATKMVQKFKMILII